MKIKWVKETPTEEGWYWLKYKNKHNKFTICPALVVILTIENDTIDGVLVSSARGDTFVEGKAHGGPGLKQNGVLDKSIRFGTKIEEPEE